MTSSAARLALDRSIRRHAAATTHVGWEDGDATWGWGARAVRADTFQKQPATAAATWRPPLSLTSSCPQESALVVWGVVEVALQSRACVVLCPCLCVRSKKRGEEGAGGAWRPPQMALDTPAPLLPPTSSWKGKSRQHEGGGARRESKGGQNQNTGVNGL